MGYTRHHAIIVTGFDKFRTEQALVEARRLGNQTSALMESKVNGWWTFMVAPDGSNEGWEPSEAGDERRGDFIVWLDGQRYSDGSSPFSWVEVQYGDDDGETVVTAHSDEPFREHTPDQPRDAREGAEGGV